MDCLSKEQMLLLQHNLTYEVYEEFMGMFKEGEELLPENELEKKEYILDVLKQHDYFGKISGWGDERYYVNIPQCFDESSLKVNILQHPMKTRKELIDYLDDYPDKGRLDLELQDRKKSCMRVNDDHVHVQVKMTDRWKNDSMI